MLLLKFDYQSCWCDWRFTNRSN